MNVMPLFSHGFFPIISLLLLILLSVSIATPADVPTTRIAMYMVGSDLESESHLGSAEIKEILSGLSGDSRHIDLQIAYGGARSMGWSGMIIADKEDLQDDYRDGVIGNGHYAFRDTSMNMGDTKGLTTFVEYLNDLPASDRNIFIFWDHGASLAGLCFDENYNWDQLTMQEITDALENSAITWDLIGMDACLMGSLEVMQTVSPFGHLLLVSEEVEPGHGWDYEIPLQALSDNPAITIEEWAKLVIDSYMDNPQHEPMKKTLSLIQMTSLPDLEEDLSLLGTFLRDKMDQKPVYEGIGTSFYNAQRFGYDPRKDIEVSVDLGDLSDNLGMHVKDSSDIIGQVKQTMASVVLYQRNDGSRPKSTGISTISPRNRHIDEISASSGNSIHNSTWFSFIKNYVSYISTDSSKPVITTRGNGTFQVSDDQGIQMVMVKTDWMPDVTNFTHSFGMKADPVYPDAQGIYIPNPDDKTFYLTDTGTGNRSYFYNTYYGTDINGTELYFGFVNITRGSKTRETAINIMQSQDGLIQYALFPYEINPSTGEYLFSRIPLTVRTGDIITPVIVERFLGGESRWQYTALDPLLITGELAIERDRLPYGSYLPSLWAYDYNMNYDIYLMDVLRFPNSAEIISQ